MLLLVNFPLTVHIILWEPSSYGSSFYFAYICSNCRQTNQNHSTMSLTSTVSYLSNTFSLYCVYFCLIYCIWYHSMNQISSMTSLTMMGLTPGPLVRALFHFALLNLLVVLENLLVVSVTWGLAFPP